MTSSAADLSGPIDPFAVNVDGVYRDDVVEVRALRGVRPRRLLHMVRTPHFDITHVGDRLHVDHVVPPDAIDDDLSGLLADELFAPGWLRGSRLFERIFTGVVLSSAPDSGTAWRTFYANTLARVDETVRGVPAAGGNHGTIADYAPVYAHVETHLAPGSVLELGCCFGFLSLRLAAQGRTVCASDLSAGSVRLLESVAPSLGISLSTQVADAARYPGEDGFADNVLVVHLLEHLEPEHGDRVVAEAVRLARRRVVIAVPLEEEADETWGHVRTVSLDDLRAWGVGTGLPFEVHEHHGGWLVIDKG
jgi:SAM-dependent methyltransferase